MTTPQMLDERYGRRTGARSRWPLAIVAVVGAALLGLLSWTTISGAMNTVQATDTGFRIDGPRAVTVAFQVGAPAGRSIACALEALDPEHGTVGWRIVEYAASDEHTRAFRETIPTTAEATTGLVNSCWVT